MTKQALTTIWTAMVKVLLTGVQPVQSRCLRLESEVVGHVHMPVATGVCMHTPERQPQARPDKDVYLQQERVVVHRSCRFLKPLRLMEMCILTGQTGRSWKPTHQGQQCSCLRSPSSCLLAA